MRWFALFLVVMVSASLAVEAPRSSDLSHPVSVEREFVGGLLDAAKSDTLVVYGGPGSLEGKFQNAGGVPDRQGWVGVDVTSLGLNVWNVNTYQAAALDP